MVLCREKGLAISLRRNFITISSPKEANGGSWLMITATGLCCTIATTFDYENASPVPGYHNQHVNYATPRNTWITSLITTTTE